MPSEAHAVQFGRVRNFFWPIYGHEMRRVVPMCIMLFLICWNYSTIRNIKDALVVTAEKSGAEVLPFIKLWVMLPMAFLLTILFTYLSNRYSQEQVFYLIIGGFLTFFVFFLFILYPLQHFLHPHALADRLQEILPTGLKGMIAMFRNWTFTLFYVFAELWGCIVLQVVFWGFANEVTKVGESKRFYSMFGVGSNLAAVLAGQSPKLWGGSSDEQLFGLMFMFVLSGIATMMIFRWLNANVLSGAEFEELHARRFQPKTKKKLPLMESFLYLKESRYLLCIAVMVVAYNLVINVVEVVWKEQLRMQHSQFNGYNSYLGDLTTFIGVLSMIFAFCIPLFIEKFGWTKAALVTPMVVLITGTGFFTLFLFHKEIPDSLFILLGISPLSLLVLFGTLQNGLSKAAKYSFYDATKDMAFIPLDHDVKLKGKAAIDGVGSRLGKSGSAFLYQTLLLFFSSLSAIAPYLVAILMVVVCAWIYATVALGKEFALLAAKKDQRSPEEEDSAQYHGEIDSAVPQAKLAPS